MQCVHRIRRSGLRSALPCLASCIFLTACGDGPSASQEGPESSAAGRLASSSAASPAGIAQTAAFPALGNEAIDLNVRDEELPAVLRALSARTGIRIHNIEATQGIRSTLALQGVPAEQAIARLLARFDTILYRSAGTDNGAQLAAVWIFARGAGADLAPERTAGAGAAKRVTAAAPDERALAYEQLMLDRSAPPSLLSAGLADTDPAVRRRVLSQAGVTGINLPADTLLGIAQTDADEAVREAALSAIAAHPDIQSTQAQAIASRAASDASPMVQNKAREILDGLQMRRAGGMAQIDPPAGAGSVDADQAGIPVEPGH